MYMKKANIAEIRDNLSAYVAAVEQGEEVLVCKRNIAVARIVPIRPRRKNRTTLGSERGSCKVHGDLTEPLIPVESWAMLGGDH